MKKATLTLIIALGLVVPAVASAGTSSDKIVASFERDLNREAVSTYATHRDMDPVQYLVNSSLSKGSDQIVASFERDLNRGAVALSTLHEIRIGVDVLDVINTTSASTTA
jgi:hypothetical protein